jgi:hypothetical protein
MLNKNIDLKNSSFFFSDYFKLNIDTDELLNEFGFSFEKKLFLLIFRLTKIGFWVRN